MLKYLFLSFLFFQPLPKSQEFAPTDVGSKVHFVIKNFGINTGGDFTGLKGSIIFNPNDLTTSQFNVTVAASTVDTDNQSRDKSLRSAEYFDVQKYPDIRLTSTKISATNKTATGFYYFTGNISIHGVTKTISFPFKAELINNDYLFTADFDLNRLDFGVGEKSSVLSNKVSLSLKVMAKKK